MIITGDLGDIGRTILLDLLKEKGINIADIYTDCGMQIYDAKKQGTMSGGSGCGCSYLFQREHFSHKSVSMKENPFQELLMELCLKVLQKINVDSCLCASGTNLISVEKRA